MLTNILQYLERTVSWLPEKTAFRDDEVLLSYRALQTQARAVGSFLLSRGLTRKPAAVFMEQRPGMTAALLGAAYAGCWFVPVDAELPPDRLEQLLDRVHPAVILCDEETGALLSGSPYARDCVRLSEAVDAPVDEARLAQVRAAQTDTDPVCVCFSGEPARGIVYSHRNLMESAAALADCLDAGPDCVLGSLASFGTVAGIRDILCTLRGGGTCCLLPRRKGTAPPELTERLNRYGIHAVCWPAAVLQRVFSPENSVWGPPAYLRRVAWTGKAPQEMLAAWCRFVPDACFVGLYGPPECAGLGLLRRVSAEPPEAVPVWVPFPNVGVLLLDQNGAEARRGEICIRGSSLALGYYGAPELTAAAFVRNPAAPDIPERIFRTGDYGEWKEQGQLMLPE